MSLISKLKKATTSGAIDVMAKSEFSTVPYCVPTPTTLLNLAVYSEWDSGVPASKLTMFSGIPSSGKTRVVMLTATEFLNQNKDGVVILIDAEYASNAVSSIKDGLDPERVLHIPLSRVLDEDKDRNLEYQLIKIMEQINKGDKVMIILDSLSALQGLDDISKGDDGKVTRSMNHGIPEKKRLLYRILEEAGLKQFGVMIINHVTQNLSGFGDTYTPKGGSLLFIPSVCLMFTSKAKLKGKDGCRETGVGDDDIVGSVITSVTYKGRFSKENLKVKFAQHSKYGFLKYYGLFDYAKDGNFIELGKDGRTTTIKFTTKDGRTFEIHKRDMYLPKNYEFWEELLKSGFGVYLNKLFQYGDTGTTEEESNENNTSKK